MVLMPFSALRVTEVSTHFSQWSSYDLMLHKCILCQGILVIQADVTLRDANRITFMATREPFGHTPQSQCVWRGI